MIYSMRMLYFGGALIFAALSGETEKPESASMAATFDENLREAISSAVSFQYGDSEAAFRTLDDFINANEKNKSRLRLLEEELAMLLDSNASYEAKRRVCKLLQRIGTRHSAPVLEAMMKSGDLQLAEMACYAAAGNVAEAYKGALASALEEAEGKIAIAILNSLGKGEGEEVALRSIMKLAQAPEPEVASAALAALGRKGAPQAAKYLLDLAGAEGTGGAPGLGFALLQAAGECMEAGERSIVDDIYSKLLGTDYPGPVRRGAFLGKLNSVGDEASTEVLDVIRGQDETLVPSAISLIPRLEGGRFTTLMLCGLLHELPSTRRVRVIKALALRGDTAAIPTMVGMLASEGEKTRIAVIEALTTLNNPGVVPVFLRLLHAEEEPRVLRAVRKALARLDGGPTERLLVRELFQGDRVHRLEFINILSARPTSEVAATALFKMARREDPEESGQALKALRSVATAGDVPLAMALLRDFKREGKPIRPVLQLLAALSQKPPVQGKSGLRRMIEAASEDRNAFLLPDLIRVAGMTRDPEALPFVDSALSGPAQLAREAAAAAIRMVEMSAARGKAGLREWRIINRIRGRADLSEFRDSAEKILVEVESSGLLFTTAGEQATDQFFDGETLNGWWTPNPGFWSVEDGAIVGRTTESISKSQYIWSKMEVDDFYLSVDIRIRPPLRNAGIQFRSWPVDELGRPFGYQADAGRNPDGENLWGKIYHERGRKKLDWNNRAVGVANDHSWNRLEVLAVDDRIWTAVNGKPTSALHDPDGERSGYIAFQIHFGLPQVVLYRINQLVLNPEITLAGKTEAELNSLLITPEDTESGARGARPERFVFPLALAGKKNRDRL